MAKQKRRLTGRQIGILAILIEENVKRFPHLYGTDEEIALQTLRQSVDSHPELPKWSAKILDEPIEMLFEYLMPRQFFINLHDPHLDKEGSPMW